MKIQVRLTRSVAMLAFAAALFGHATAAFAQTSVSLSATDSVVAETVPGQSPNPGNIRITRTGSTTGALTVWLKLSGSAVRGTDFTFGVNIGTTAIIPAGSAHLDLAVNPIDDTTVEATEGVRVELEDETASGTPPPYSIGADRVTLNLLDNDSLPAPALVSVDTLQEAAEGSDATGPVPGAFRITRTGNTGAALTVFYLVTGSAARGADYAPLAGSLVIPAGTSFADIAVIPVDDDELEINERVSINLLPSAPSALFPPPASAYGFGAEVSADLTISENEIAPVRAVVDVSALNDAAENRGGAPVSGSFRFTRTANMDVALIVTYSISGNATAGGDYMALSGSVLIPAGVATADVTLTPVDDLKLEPAESVTLTINPTNCPDLFPPPECYLAGASAKASVTIADNEIPPALTFTATQDPAVFGQPGAGLGSLTASSPAGHIVSWQLSVDGTARSAVSTGYSTPPAAGTPFQGNFPIPTLRIGSHSLQVTVTDNHGSTATTTTALTIAFIIPTFPRMSVAALDAEASEVPAGSPANSAVFRISVEAPMAKDQYVVYRLASPGPGADFGYPAGYSETNWPMFWPVGPTDYGHALFPAGTTSVDIVVTPLDDAINEGTENLTLSLSYPFVFTERTFEGIVQFTEGGFYTPPYDPYALPVRYFDYDISAQSTATASILDNDTEPTPFAFISISSTDADAAETAPGEPANPGAFTVARVGPTNLPLIVNYQITTRPRDIPLRFPIPVQAQNGVDFAPISSGTLTIPAGASSAQIVIAPIQDSLVESSEYVQVQLQPSTFAVPSPHSYLLFGGSLGSLVIRDLAPSPLTPVVRIKAADSQAIEAGTTSRTGAFLVERIGSGTASLTVGYTVSGSATNGVDFTTLPGTVTIPAGALNALITIDPIADGLTEPVEIVKLILLAPPPGISPVPYVISAAGTTSNCAGVSIRDLPPPGFGLTRRQLIVARRLGHLHRIIPIPAPAVPQAASAPPIEWIVQASNDLQSWQEIGRTTDPDEFVDVTPDDENSRFYRVMPVAP